MVRNVEAHLLPAGRHNWVGNDSKGRHHHGKVPRIETRCLVHLSWRRNNESPIQFVGGYELDMAQLLVHGYIRDDGPESVRLRFFHADDDNIYIQTSHDGPRWRVGTAST